MAGSASAPQKSNIESRVSFPGIQSSGVDNNKADLPSPAELAIAQAKAKAALDK